MNPIPLFEIVRRVSKVGAFGMLIHIPSQVPICGTLERTYGDNSDTPAWSSDDRRFLDNKFRPKIPDSPQYGWHCHRDFYHKGGYDTFEVNIPFHDRILFHKGNWPQDSDGCILLGEQYKDFDPKEGVQNPGLADSKRAFTEFMQLTRGVDSFFLKVASI